MPAMQESHRSPRPADDRARGSRGTHTVSGHGGQLAAASLTPFGVEEMFTLSGGHIFPFYDAAVAEGQGDGRVRVIDIRHEQTATFAAEGIAKLTRRPGVAVLTAGPGSHQRHLCGHHGGLQRIAPGGAGRPGPAAAMGVGSLQEFDHVPVLAPDHQARRHGDQHRRHLRRHLRGAAHCG